MKKLDITIYHLDYFYDENDEKVYYISPYSLRGTIWAHTRKCVAVYNCKNKSYKTKRDIKGLFKFFTQSSFNENRLYSRFIKKGYNMYNKENENNINPYPKYSYNSGLVNSDGSAVYGMDVDYMFYEAEHGRLPKPPEE